MDRRVVDRIVEMIGSFLLGGGVVAAAYELAGSGAGRTESGASTGAGWSPGWSWGGGRGTEASGGADGQVAFGDDRGTSPSQAGAGEGLARPPAPAPISAMPPIHAAEEPFDAAAELAFPKHGLVTTLAAIVRDKPDTGSALAGILRSGTRLRVSAEPTFGGGCGKGWYQVFPRGWLCRDAGLAVGSEPPDDAIMHVPDPRWDEPLPYEYWRVKDNATPFFHRLPSYGEQDGADAAGAAWVAKHGMEPMPTDPARRPADVPAVVKEFMNPGYWITKAGEEVKAKRYFVRTLRGSYVRKYQLHQREAPQHRGLLLPGEGALPLYFVRREIPWEQRSGEGSDVLGKSTEVPARLGTVPLERKIMIGNIEYYEAADGRLLRAYAVGRAAKIRRPAGLAPDERWIHIDLSEQVLVAYEGDVPVFTTLVSTGKAPGMTPVGLFRVETKHTATSMRDQPQEEEAYSIEDVPWTQYFHANIALHGAFWHAGFGTERSHGCVNLSPADARWLFGFTRPVLPAGWHSVAQKTLGSGEGTAIYITE